jgi:hypothetical protein
MQDDDSDQYINSIDNEQSIAVYQLDIIVLLHLAGFRRWPVTPTLSLLPYCPCKEHLHENFG